MRDPAAAAAMLDPENNLWFSRCWSERQIPPAPVTAAAGSTVPHKDQDYYLGLLGHALLQQWRRERANREVVP